jgi:iron-sulfur cluster assembly protein
LITVTEHAREVLRGYERPEGTALRLDPANGNGPDGPLARLGFGEPKGDDQVVDREGEEILRIGRSVSEALNGSEIGVVSTLEGPSLDIREPTGTWPLPDDSQKDSPPRDNEGHWGSARLRQGLQPSGNLSPQYERLSYMSSP